MRRRGGCPGAPPGILCQRRAQDQWPHRGGTKARDRRREAATADLLHNLEAYEVISLVCCIQNA